MDVAAPTPSGSTQGPAGPVCEDLIVEQDRRPFSSAEEIVRRYKAAGYDDMVVVAPLSVIARLIDLGIRPLWCEMDQVDPRTGSPDITYRGRGYKFIRFRRVKTVKMEFEEI